MGFLKQLIVTSILAAILSSGWVQARTVEVEVHGMTCAFCVENLERKFGKMPTVQQVDVSLKQKKLRLQTDANEPSLEVIKQAILDAGFTPVKVIVTDNEAQ